MSDGSDGGSFGELGRTLDDLQRSAFFQWFSLQPDGNSSVFRPEGPAFHDKVAFHAVTSAGRITQLTLTLSRSFIDDPREKPFAVDIIKSFVAAAAGNVLLAQALEHDMISSQPSRQPAVMTLHGLRHRYEEQLARGFSVVMENTPNSTFVVTIRRDTG